jgi:hypothetical protein
MFTMLKTCSSYVDVRLPFWRMESPIEIPKQLSSLKGKFYFRINFYKGYFFHPTSFPEKYLFLYHWGRMERWKLQMTTVLILTRFWPPLSMCL